MFWFVAAQHPTNSPAGYDAITLGVPLRRQTACGGQNRGDFSSPLLRSWSHNNLQLFTKHVPALIEKALFKELH